MPSDWPSDLIVYACLAAGLVCGLVAGVFLSFSDFVMRSLVAARPEGGIESMQMINRKVYRSLFLVMLLGMAPVSVGFAVYAYLFLAGPASTLITAGATIYLAGVFLVTVLANVPMNKRLDDMDPYAQQTADYWTTYGIVWTRWNHVRTLGSLATALCFLFAGITLA